MGVLFFKAQCILDVNMHISKESTTCDLKPKLKCA